MTRVWLTGWEWDCCGDAFAVGDNVDFGIESRTVMAPLRDLLGATVSDSVDAMESHHVESFPDRIAGRVTAVHAVTVEVIERQVLRRPGRGAPPDATMPAEREDWPLVGPRIGEASDGEVVMGFRPSRFIILTEQVAESAMLEAVPGVRLGESPRGPSFSPDRDGNEEWTSERRSRSQMGWLVDIDQLPPVGP